MAVNTCTVITAPGRLRQEEFQLEASETLSQKKRKKGKGKKKIEVQKGQGTCPRSPCKQNNNPPPKSVHIIIPKTGEYVILHNERDFAAVIKLRIFR
jgi:hypothetical protein